MTEIKVVNMYDRKLVVDNPNWLFVFGDNTWRIGNGGQAIIRGLPNTFGIATKLKPSQQQDSYFNDLVPYHWEFIKGDLLKLKQIQIQNIYEYIVFPSGGLGTGLSAMPIKCPRLFELMNKALLKGFGYSNPN